MPPSDARKTPAGLGGAPRNPSPLGAPLDEIEVPDAPAWMTVEGVRLLYALQHKLPPFYHHLGPRFNKNEFVKVARLSGVHHRATCFEGTIDEVWQLLDPQRAGFIENTRGIEVLKLQEMAKKLKLNEFPYDRDDQLPSYYGNSPELADPKWRQKEVRRERDLQRIEEISDARLPAPGSSIFHRNRNREAHQDALIEARASMDTRNVIPGVRDKRAWERRNENQVANDVFSYYHIEET